MDNNIIKFPPATAPRKSIPSEPDPNAGCIYAVSADSAIYLWAHYRWIHPDPDRAAALLAILERQRGPEAWTAVQVPQWVHDSVHLIDETACEKAMKAALKEWVES